MCKNGVKQMVLVDDQIPCKNHHPSFAQCNGKEIWVLLVEKAWAKIHGNYERVEGGQAHLTMRDLTGAPGYEYTIAETPDMFDKLVNGESKNYAMAAGISDDNGSLKDMGLIGEHSYGVLKAVLVQDADGNDVQLVQVRNPWGKTEWQGDWSDNSDKWTDELKEQLSWTDADDGAFWMDFNDFKQYFGRCQICEVSDTHQFSFVKHTGPYGLLKFSAQSSGEYTFSVSQKGERMFPRNSGYQYSNARLWVVKILGDGQFQYIQGYKTLKTRDVYLKVEDLAVADYYLVTQVDWIEGVEDHDYVVTSYGESGLSFEDETSSLTVEEVLRGSCQQMVEEELIDKKDDETTIKKYWLKTADIGYITYMIKNEDEESTYKESMSYPTFDGCTMCEPESGAGYEAVVEAGQTKIILIKLECNGYSMASSFSSMVIKGDNSLIQQCIEEGEKNERAPGIFQCYLQHSAGIIYVYKNETTDQTLNEEAGFNLEGLTIDGQEDQTKVDITLGPGEQIVIKLVTTGGGYSIGTSTSYSISTA